MVWWPQVEAFVRCVAAGSWPVWDPSRGFGQPLLADPSSQILYPLTWLNLVMPSWAYYTLFAVMHLVWSGMGMGALARQLGVGPLGAFLASVVWTVSGPFLSLAQLYHHFASAAWLPWVFLAGYRLLETRRLRDAVVCALAMAAQTLAGSADMAALTLLALGLYGLVCRLDWRRPLGPANRSMLLFGALAFVLAAGVTATLWLPTLDLATRSARWGLPTEDRTTWSVHPFALVELVLPFSLNTVRTLSPFIAEIVYPKGPWLASLYFGGPAVLLTLWGARVAPTRLRGFLLGLGGGSVLFALGSHTPFYRLMVLLLPSLQIFRYPVKAMILTAFAWSLLVGFGLQGWRTPRTPGGIPWRQLTSSLLLLLAGTTVLLGTRAVPWLLPGMGAGQDPERIIETISGGLTWAGAMSSLAIALALFRGNRIPAKPWMTVGVVAVVVGDLVGAQRALHPAAPRALATTRPAVLEVLGRTPDTRLFVYDYSLATKNQFRRGNTFANWYELARLPVGFTPHEGLVFGVQMYLNPPTAGRWGLNGSFDLDLLGLQPKPQADLTEFLREVEDSPLHLRLLQMGGVTHVLALHPAPWWRDLVPIASVSGSFAQAISVFRVPDTLPRTYAVGNARFVKGPQALKAVADPGFDPRREVVLFGEAQARAVPGFSGTSRVVGFAPDRVRIEAALDQPGYVVLLDAYDEGWKAKVDGRVASLLRANMLFRAVEVPAGRHTIDLAYRPDALTLGLVISAMSLSVLGVLAAWDHGSRRGRMLRPPQET